MMFVDKNNLPQELLNIPDSEFQAIQKEEIKDEKFQTKPVGFFKDAMIRLRHSKVAMISATIILVVIVLAIFVPHITGYVYTAQNIDPRTGVPGHL